MKQIDQDPGDYRVQRQDGSWTQRVNKPLCRWMGIAGMVFLAYLAWALWREGGAPEIILGTAALAFACGTLITLSLKSTDW